MDCEQPEVMNLVIIHYHLKRGGVTSVIANQLKSLDFEETPVSKILVLHGPDDTGWDLSLDSGMVNFQFERKMCSEFGYEQSDAEFNPDLAKTIVEGLDERGFERDQTVIQIHNHGLGKNNSITAAVSGLADAGFGLLLQIHDFAEDFRPRNFEFLNRAAKTLSKTYQQLVYPKNSRIHYGCLNRRDFDALLESGVDESHLHFLPNPIAVGDSVKTFDSNSTAVGTVTNHDSSEKVSRIGDAIGVEGSKQLVLFPVRAIRRKNIGEAILFAAVHEQVHVAITLPAVSPVEKESYDPFVRFSREHSVPVSFECGTKGIEYRDLVDAADCIFTSSVTEGFGMAFLESWLSGKMMVGRNLPEITADFVDAGLDLSLMYEHVWIPTNWFDVEKEIVSFANAFENVCHAYARPNVGRPQIETIFAPPHIDFAILSTQTQRAIIRLILNEAERKQEFMALNPSFTVPDVNDVLISSNAQVVKENFSIEQFGKVFVKVLMSTITQSRSESGLLENTLAPGRSESSLDVLTTYLDVGRFYPLRVESTDGAN